MKLPRAQEILLRRQEHLDTRVGKSQKVLSYDKAESAAISCVLLEIKRMENLKGK